MDTGSDKYYKTGEFAKLCNVNKRTLFHYDEIGLFQPDYVDANGYRYYSEGQFMLFSTINILKDLNVPLNDIKKYLEVRNSERAIQMSEEKIKDIDREIERLTYFKHTLRELIHNVKQGMHADFETIMVEEQEEEFIIRSESLIALDKEEYISWMLAFHHFEDRSLSKDTSFVGYLLSRERILNGDYHSKSFFYVKTKSKKKSKTTSTSVKPKGWYAVAYHHGSYETIGETYEKIVKYSIREGWNLGDYAYEEYLIDEVAEQSELNYVTRITIGVQS
ncbi:MerR family transcriptional regulator [Paenibacillus sp. SAF-068]|uniref:MerR family transcriptional regulator n=1 Tax=Paenibacillus sp. SAF-068 TaxID=3436864 RepID=UPI003F7EB63E